MLGNEGVEENMNKEGKHKIKAWIKLHNIIINTYKIRKNENF